MDYKEALYHFRKFAIKEGFIKEYAKYSNWGLFGKHGVKDIPDHLKYTEPVKYIQNASFFCSWPSPDYCDIKWRAMSEKWARYCFENGIYYEKENAEQYARIHIFHSFRVRF